MSQALRVFERFEKEQEVSWDQNVLSGCGKVQVAEDLGKEFLMI